MLHRESESIINSNVTSGNKTYRQVLISSDDAPNFSMRKFIINPGGFMPLHTNTVEHEQYVLNGSAEITIGEKVFTAKKNDVIYIPAGVEHNYKNVGSEPFEFLCIVPNREDIIKLVK